MTGSDHQAAYYPIRVVAAETGVNAITLRAWERRYGLITPKRTAKGHRLYTEQDIKLIKQVVTLLDRGLPISQAQAMLANGDALNLAERPLSDSASQWQHYREQLHTAVQEFDDESLSHIFEEVCQFFPVDVAIRFLFMPFYQQLRLKETLTLGPARLNFYRSFLQARMAWRITNSKQRPHASNRILLTNSTQSPDIQPLLLAILLQQLDMGVTRLSGIMTPEHITELLKESGRWSAALVQVETTPSQQRISQLKRIALETGYPIFITGQHIELNPSLRQAGLIPLGDDIQQAALNIRDLVASST